MVYKGLVEIEASSSLWLPQWGFSVCKIVMLAEKEQSHRGTVQQDEDVWLWTD